MTLYAEPTLDTADWCDRCGGWVAKGATKPMEPRSQYRICDRCVASLRDTWCPRCHVKFAYHVPGKGCPGELGPDGARYQDGER